MPDNETKTFSVSWRIQRVTVEYAYVSVPVVNDLLMEQPDRTRRIDADKMGERAVEMAKAPGVKWHPQDQNLFLHPIQKAPEPDER